ncbi:hypothetical protein ACTG16_22950 [Aeromonas sp. 23P]|uniref:hypothetical protein n=1 Tax=Aeromonas sp. 23P TaxID=3452716 RepID=UPI003F7B1B94|nr:hypothetical protein [Aeromonas veronii]
MQMTQIPTARFYVLNENTLCYQQCGSSMYGALASNKHGRNPVNGPFFVGSQDALRPATVADFDTFRVSVKGYEQDLALQAQEIAQKQARFG